MKFSLPMPGVPFHERGRMADEYLAAIIELWTSESPKFEGKYVTFDDVAFEPKPVQKPHLPIWIGGDADAALRRAAQFASGWFAELGVTMSSVPIPPVADVNAYLHYAQWVIEEIKPEVP